MVPVIFTILAIIAVLFTAFLERKSSGWLAGIGTVIVFIASCATTLVAWIVWGLMQFIK